jgi:DNA-binding XRE family transcriptional regulator
MLVVVKKRPTEFVVQGNIPEKYLKLLKKDYGKNATITNETGDYVAATEMSWYKEMKAEETPGDTLRFYRKLHHMTQKELAEKIEVTKQKISNMEHGLKAISRKTAYQLSEIFGIAAGRFI